MNKLLAALVTLFAIASAQAQPLAPPVVTEGADPAIWEGDAVSGPIIHRASRVSFAADVDGFARSRVVAVGPDDVAANYQAREGETETSITVYLFKPGSLPEHKLKGSVTAFAEVSPTAFIWSSGPFDVSGATPLHGYKGVYKTGIGADTRMDYLYFFELGEWTVKVRATVSRIKEVAQEDRIDAFVRALPWDGIFGANGACVGSACTASPFDAFDHHTSELMLGPLLLRAMKFDARKERGLPLAAQVRLGLLGAADIRSSTEDPLVYVAEVNGMGTYRLVKIPDVASAMMTETFGKLSVHKPLYGVVIRMGGDDLMPRFFHGQPTPEAFGAAIEELILHPTASPFVTVKETAEAMPD